MPKDKPLTDKEINAELDRIQTAYFSHRWPDIENLKAQKKGEYAYKIRVFKDSGNPMNSTNEEQCIGYNWTHESQCGYRGQPDEPGDIFFFNIWLKDYEYPKPTALLDELENILNEMIAKDEQIVVFMDDAGGDEAIPLTTALDIIQEKQAEKK